MKHATLSELALYAGEDCGLFRRWRIGRHVRECAACREEVRAQRTATDALRDHIAQMPSSVNWDRLSEEMTANIRVGLAAGECVGDFPVKRRARFLRWNIATSMAMLALLFAAAFVINLPQSQSEHLAGSLRRIIGLDRAHSAAETMSAAPAFGILEASPQQIAMHSNGSVLSIVPDSAANVRVSVSLQGSAAARVIDADTGQVTISQVYDAQ
jgi:hypothetical protein